MKRKQGVNIVAFGSFFQLVRSLTLRSWDFDKIGLETSKSGLGLMMLPVRGSRFLRQDQVKILHVVAMEEAWNTSTFGEALWKFLKDLKYVISGSPTSFKGSSKLDRISGMNFQGQGTIVDWLLFGNQREAYLGFVKLLKLWPKAIVSHHSPCGSGVVEVHPEFRRSICSSRGISKFGFVKWLMYSNQLLCIDTFHTFQRGSRDGKEPNPVVPQELRMEFLKAVGDRVPEVHFRLNKREVELVLQNRVEELPLFPEMQYMYRHFDDAVFILEIYPDLFSTVQATAVKVEKMWKILDSKLG